MPQSPRLTYPHNGPAGQVLATILMVETSPRYSEHSVGSFLYTAKNPIAPYKVLTKLHKIEDDWGGDW